MTLMPTNTKTTEAPQVAINVPLPADLHKKLRTKALARDLSVKDAVTDAIRQWAK